ncbi:MAG: 5'-methylthioadenosine/S-adenosylhomocysteine nucleosidase, partial [Oscillospiraceae bacterium]|nr:5'-methylthioadenosine/S-adenosylhomocysteine nucleosidase [Oscillospiraceae bacterium]
MKIGIIGAMQMEVDALQAAMTNPTQETVSGITFVSGTIDKHTVVAAVCGIGKVFAAMCAQTMILKYAPEAIINIGVAGTVTSGLQVLDIAIADNVCQHDMDTSPLGDPVGLISGINQIYFPADSALAQTIAAAADKLGCRHITGTIASGD